MIRVISNTKVKSPEDENDNDMRSRRTRYIRYSVEYQQLNPLHLPLHIRYMPLQCATSLEFNDLHSYALAHLSQE
jgi:hypothetical protein